MRFKTAIRLTASIFVGLASVSPGWASLERNNPFMNRGMERGNQVQLREGMNPLQAGAVPTPKQQQALDAAANAKGSALNPAEREKVMTAVTQAQGIMPPGRAFTDHAAQELGKAIVQNPDMTQAARGQLINAAVWGSQFVKSDAGVGTGFTLQSTPGGAVVNFNAGSSTHDMQIFAPPANPSAKVGGDAGLKATEGHSFSVTVTRPDVTRPNGNDMGSGQLAQKLNLGDATPDQVNAFNVAGISGHMFQGNRTDNAPGVTGPVTITFTPNADKTITAHWEGGTPTPPVSPGQSMNPAPGTGETTPAPGTTALPGTSPGTTDVPAPTGSASLRTTNATPVLPTPPASPTGARTAPSIPPAMVNAVASANGGDVTAHNANLGVQVTPTGNQSLVVVQTPPNFNNPQQITSNPTPVAITITGVLNGQQVTIPATATAQREQSPSGPATNELSDRNGTLAFTVPAGFHLQTVNVAKNDATVPSLTFSPTGATFSMSAPKPQNAAPVASPTGATPANALNTGVPHQIVPKPAIEFAGLTSAAPAGGPKIEALAQPGSFRFVGTGAQLPAGSTLRGQLNVLVSDRSPAPANVKAAIRDAIKNDATGQLRVTYNAQGLITHVDVPRSSGTGRMDYRPPATLRDDLLRVGR